MLTPAYRVVLLALFVAPIGGVLVQANVLRNLILVIPAALLTMIGVAALLDWIVGQIVARQRHQPTTVADHATGSAGDEISGLDHRAGSIRLA